MENYNMDNFNMQNFNVDNYNVQNHNNDNKAILYFNEIKDLLMILSIIAILFCAYYNVAAGIYIAMSIAILCLIITVITHLKNGSWVYLIITAILVIGLSIALPIALKDKMIFGFKINVPISISCAIAIAYIVEKICFVLYETVKIIGDFVSYITNYHRN